MSTVHALPTPRGLGHFGPEVEDAWGNSFLADLPTRSVERVVQEARLADLETGEIFYRGAYHESTATVALVVSGLVRIYLKASEGRTVTVRYGPPGTIIGLPAVLLGGTGKTGDHSLERWRLLGGSALDGEALRSSTILKLRPSCVRAAMEQDLDVARALALNLAEQLTETQRLFAADLFLPIRSRVAGHLLSLAERDSMGMIVRSNHQNIAEAIGSVREVVSRALKRMEQDGLVRRVGRATDGYLRLLDPAELHRLSTDSGREDVPPTG